MAHFAELNEHKIVLRVVVIDNKHIQHNDEEYEHLGINFCNNLFGGHQWVQTSYNKNFRKNYAGIGYTYDENLDAFIPPKPFDSWTLNEETCQWEPPVEYPNDDLKYIWNENTTSWDIVSPL